MTKVTLISILTIVFLMAGSSRSAVPNEESSVMMILEKCRDSLTWADSVSMNLAIDITPTGVPGKKPWKLVYVFNRDHDRVEWNGIAFFPDSNGNPDPDPKQNVILRTIITEREFVSVVGNPGLRPLGASITTELEGVKDELLDDNTSGGPLFGRALGNKHKSIPDLLCESGDVLLRPEMEIISDIPCYVLEGTTRYGRVTTWIAPEKGFAPLKWTVEKTADNLINDKPMSETGLILWVDQFECKEFRQIGDSFIPVRATYNDSTTLKDGGQHTTCCDYIVTDIQLNPDFNSIGAFKIDLPQGTKITVPESPGIRFIWKDGKAVPDVNPKSFDEIDRTIDRLKQQQ